MAGTGDAACCLPDVGKGVDSFRLDAPSYGFSLPDRFKEIG
jgi:hypothetical protein